MKFLIFFIIITFLNSCIKTPGINKSPSSQKQKNILIENSINEVEINIISINKLTDSQIDFYNKKKIQEFDHKIKKFENSKHIIIVLNSNFMIFTAFFLFLYSEDKYSFNFNQVSKLPYIKKCYGK